MLMLFTFIKIMLFVSVIFIFIPSKLLALRSQGNKLLDRVFISLTHMVLALIISVHVLVVLRIYDFLSLTFFLLLIYYGIYHFSRPKSSALEDGLGLKNKILLRSIKFFEREKQHFTLKYITGVLLEQLKTKVHAFKYNIRYFFVHPFSGVLPTFVVLIAGYFRFKHAFIHASFSHIDVYSQLIGIKNLGFNKIYEAGVYPYGHHAIISAISKLVSVDAYWASRFLGPLDGVLLVLSVYYFATRITKNYFAGLISLAIYGLVTSAAFPEVMFRQTALLPQEFAAIFVLPGLYFFRQYLFTRKKSFLLLFMEALAITVFVHPYATVFLGLWSLAMFLCAIPWTKINFLMLKNLILFGMLTMLISSLPLVLGKLFGKSFHGSSFEMVEDMASFHGVSSQIIDLFTNKFFTNSIFLDVIFPSVLIILTGMLFIRNKAFKVSSLAIALSVPIMYILYRIPELFPGKKLPELITSGRTGVFFALILAPMYAIVFTVVVKVAARISRNSLKTLGKLAVGALSLVICIATVIQFPPEKLYEGQEEYDAAAEGIIKIRNNFPVNDWTVISPHEQLGQVMGNGWHVQLIRFVQQFSLDEAEDKNFKLPYTTDHVFLFAEKRPLHYDRNITSADAEKELEPEGDDPFMQYYKNTGQRAILEAKAIQWIEKYKETHTGVDVFYEDDDFKIYHIQMHP